MPELPDLVHIVNYLKPLLWGRSVTGAKVGDPVVLRVLVPGSFAELVAGERLDEVFRHGPFLHFGLENYDLVLHLMLAGRLRYVPPRASASQGNFEGVGGTALTSEPKSAALADAAEPESEPGPESGKTRGKNPARGKVLSHWRFSLFFDDGTELQYGDEKLMGKVYLCPKGRHEAIPLYLDQGIDITGPDFTYEHFARLIAKKRVQARVFVMDQRSLSAVGNAYADEILFEAGIHPKTPCHLLSEDERRKLYDAVNSVVTWGIRMVEEAGKPLEDKVREHMRVRNRNGQACFVCGTTIRRETVHGYDTFYCPRCQPDRTGKSLPWEKLKP